MRRITILVEDELHRRVRLKSVSEGSSIQKVLVEALERYIDPTDMTTGIEVTTSHQKSVSVSGYERSEQVGRAEPELKPAMDLSKAAQAKGKMGR